LELSWISIIPPVLAVLLAFLTRDAVISLAIACFCGVLLMGQGPQGFPPLITKSLGSESFIWICTIEFCIGILVAFFQRCGAVKMFTDRAEKLVKNRKQVSILGWCLGLFIFFSDYFSPLFVGPVMRNLTDKYRISREKLAYICDSTSSPLSVMVPITGWAVYLSGLAIGTAGITNKEEALGLFMKSIFFNFYGLFSVAFVLLIAIGIIPEFGPMRRAEERTKNTGNVLRKGAIPMMGKELTELGITSSQKPNILLNFLLPVIIIVGTNVVTFITVGTAKVMESFMLACTVLGLIMWLQKVDDLRGIMQSVYSGMKGVMPAVIILALAYCINTLTKDMHTAEYVIEKTQDWMSPVFLPALVFIVSAFISFATGTAWGTYAIMMPVALPLAFQFAGNEINTLVLASFAAVAGGGVFGDHCSPLSDTTVLSSLGSACDHIDHVKTQLPYAVCSGFAVVIIYLIIGLL